MEDGRLILALRRHGIRDERVLAAMTLLSRADFVPDRLRDLASQDEALPIGEAQTISQPFVVALMSEALEVRPGDRVLEIGTGSGYQAAVLHLLGADVYSIEVREGLARSAAENLRPFAGPRLHLRVGDGFAGWPEAAPFDAIVLTAAPERIPLTLVEQLAPGGRLVGPIGSQDDGQELIRLRKGADGELETQRLLSVRFVPMTPSPQPI
ncbi:MAG TPA: protein-L-isoaspartate(D-aspartate) O-methyltransferase [Myxococcaceae bacterium]|nr:protein-L-isoaspartate(D-aspartate) O-methyltransferase [Myxococcaceae bacterium]